MTLPLALASALTALPQQSRHVIDMMRENDLGVVFPEPTVSERPARRSLSKAGSPVPTYLDLPRVTSETIVNGLRE